MLPLCYVDPTITIPVVRPATGRVCSLARLTWVPRGGCDFVPAGLTAATRDSGSPRREIHLVRRGFLPAIRGRVAL